MQFAPILDEGAKRTAESRARRPRRRGRGRRLLLQTLESRRVLASIVVTTSIDVVDESDGVISLREAITSANSSAASDTIAFDATAFASATEIDLVLGELAVTNPVQIIGPGRELLTIDAQQTSRVMNITAATGDITIAGLTLTGGRTVDDNVESEGVIETQQSGGGIRFITDGTLTIRDSMISGNETIGASSSGGGLFVDRGTAVLSNSTISGNRTLGRSAFGGGVFASETALQIVQSQLVDNFTSGSFSDGGGLFSRGGTVEITESLVSGNRTTNGSAFGGGMYVNGDGTTIRRSTISGNRADGFGSVGGGIAMHGDVLLINSTVTGNSAASSAGSGGGIATIKGELKLVHATITENSASLGTGGGIIVMDNPGTRLEILNSIVAKNIDIGTAPDFLPPPDAGRFLVRGSLIGDNTGTTLAESQTVNSFGNLVGDPSSAEGLIDPMLGPLGNNGGPTPTRLPMTDSPVIDAGDKTLAIDPQAIVLVSDHRGVPFSRDVSSNVDMGAVEVQPAPAVPITWALPRAILVGSELTATQLNATAPVPGTFTYDPPAGTVLDAGENQVLLVQFTPDDAVNYSNGAATVTIDVVPPLEFGDAPASYATLREDDGARHGNGSLRLGSVINLEADGQPSDDALADTSDDGVRQISPILAHSTSETTTSFELNVSAASKLDGWIDFNGNGTFDHSSEHIGDGTSIDLVIRDNLISVNVPAGAVVGETFARFRVSTSGGLTPTGLAADGEVEDFVVTLIDADTAQEVSLTLPSDAVTLATDASDLTISAGATELFRAPSSSITRYVLTGADTSDVFNIDYTAGDPVPTGGLSYDGGDRVNTVRVLGDGSTLDVSAGGNVELAKIDVVDLNVSDSVALIVDSSAMANMDPDGGGLLVTGGAMDDIRFGDPEAWQIGTPLVVAGFFFTRLETGSKFIQTDLPIGWHNFVQPSDINNDQDVTAGDALRVINELVLRRFSDAENGTLQNPADFDPFPGAYFDQNGDGRVSVIDALRVINELARQQGNAEGEAGFAFADDDQPGILKATTRPLAPSSVTTESSHLVASFDVPSVSAPKLYGVIAIEEARSSESVETVDQVFAELGVV